MSSPPIIQLSHRPKIPHTVHRNLLGVEILGQVVVKITPRTFGREIRGQTLPRVQVGKETPMIPRYGQEIRGQTLPRVQVGKETPMIPPCGREIRGQILPKVQAGRETPMMIRGLGRHLMINAWHMNVRYVVPKMMTRIMRIRRRYVKSWDVTSRSVTRLGLLTALLNGRGIRGLIRPRVQAGQETRMIQRFGREMIMNYALMTGLDLPRNGRETAMTSANHMNVKHAALNPTM